MITCAQCAVFAGLAANEICLGPTPSAKHRSLLTSYLVNLKRGPEVVRDMIVSDLRCWLDLGAVQQAADLLIVLRHFLSDYPEARCVQHSGGQKDFSASHHFGINWSGRTPRASIRRIGVGAPSVGASPWKGQLRYGLNSPADSERCGRKIRADKKSAGRWKAPYVRDPNVKCQEDCRDMWRSHVRSGRFTPTVDNARPLKKDVYGLFGGKWQKWLSRFDDPS